VARDGDAPLGWAVSRMSVPVEVPWLRFDLRAFLRDAGERGEVKILYRRRPDVATREWWDLGWTDQAGRPASTAASSLQLLLRRAVEVEMDAEAQDSWDQGDRS
jgi:hypothetical protein